MRVGVVQLTSTDDLAANLKAASEWIAVAAQQGAELIALPENFAYLRREGEPFPCAQGADGDILQMLTMALTAIAAISLLVAGIGIMNVMLISVAERTSEIGLMKAVGASQGQVLVVFMAEAAALAILGGAIGVAIGVVAMQVLGAFVPQLPTTTPLWAIEAALGVALGTGVLFGTLPAAKAARMRPVDALRSRR